MCVGGGGTNDLIVRKVFSVCSELYFVHLINEPHCEKTVLRGIQSDPTQTRLYNHESLTLHMCYKNAPNSSNLPDK